MIGALVQISVCMVGFFVALILGAYLISIAPHFAARAKSKTPNPALSYDATFDYVSLSLPDDHPVHLVHVGDPLNDSSSADGHQAGLEKPVSEELGTQR